MNANPAQGDGASTLFSGQLQHGNVSSGTLTVLVGGYIVLNDLDGDGALTGYPVGSGTANYSTGDWSIDLDGVAPASGDPFLASYQHET